MYWLLGGNPRELIRSCRRAKVTNESLLLYSNGRLESLDGFEAPVSGLKLEWQMTYKWFQAAEVRRRDTLRMVEDAVRQETIERKSKDNDPAGSDV